MADDALPPGEDDFLVQEPPHWAVSGLSWLLLLLFAAAAAAAALIRIPEVVTTSFRLVPIGEGDPVRAPRDGQVIEVRAREGTAVAASNPLFVLRSDTASDRSAEQAVMRARRAGIELSLANAEARRAKERLAEEEELRGLEDQARELEAMVKVADERLELLRTLATRYRELARRGLAAEVEATAHEVSAKEAEIGRQRTVAEVEERRNRAEQIRHQRAARESAHAEAQRVLNEENVRLAIRLDALAPEAAVVDGGVAVLAPCAGDLIRVAVRTPGAVVTRGELLAEIACHQAPLRAELEIPPNGVGRVRREQKVRLLFDAFPYQRYGVRMARLSWLSPAASDVGRGPVFRAYARLTPEADPPGKPLPLRPGMGGVARVSVGKRSLWRIAFEPVGGALADLDPREEP